MSTEGCGWPHATEKPAPVLVQKGLAGGNKIANRSNLAKEVYSCLLWI